MSRDSGWKNPMALHSAADYFELIFGSLLKFIIFYAIWGYTEQEFELSMYQANKRSYAFSDMVMYGRHLPVSFFCVFAALVAARHRALFHHAAIGSARLSFPKVDSELRVEGNLYEYRSCVNWKIFSGTAYCAQARACEHEKRRRL
ncbi:hypothetical protein CEXT_258671 [Caerostris extrusa]|uniref:Uncharacterized protein n=1 Tax=Caerostris extrusa TaxID=172846 RepID=A0AAV4M3D6_CAEEX|nr:hypothetical protein CEXT_258671 [Caerostris extrusa]